MPHSAKVACAFPPISPLTPFLCRTKEMQVEETSNERFLEAELLALETLTSDSRFRRTHFQHVPQKDSGQKLGDQTVRSSCHERHRLSAVSWILELSSAFAEHSSVPFSAVSFFDAYVALNPLQSTKHCMKLVATASFLIACKMTEPLAPTIDELVSLTKGICTRDAIAGCELLICVALTFDLCIRNPHDIIHHLCSIAVADAEHCHSLDVIDTKRVVGCGDKITGAPKYRLPQSSLSHRKNAVHTIDMIANDEELFESDDEGDFVFADFGGHKHEQLENEAHNQRVASRKFDLPKSPENEFEFDAEHDQAEQLEQLIGEESSSEEYATDSSASSYSANAFESPRSPSNESSEDIKSHQEASYTKNPAPERACESREMTKLAAAFADVSLHCLKLHQLFGVGEISAACVVTARAALRAKERRQAGQARNCAWSRIQNGLWLGVFDKAGLQFQRVIAAATRIVDLWSDLQARREVFEISQRDGSLAADTFRSIRKTTWMNRLWECRKRVRSIGFQLSESHRGVLNNIYKWSDDQEPTMVIEKSLRWEPAHFQNTYVIRRHSLLRTSSPCDVLQALSRGVSAHQKLCRVSLLHEQSAPKISAPADMISSSSGGCKVDRDNDENTLFQVQAECFPFDSYGIVRKRRTVAPQRLFHPGPQRQTSFLSIRSSIHKNRKVSGVQRSWKPGMPDLKLSRISETHRTTAEPGRPVTRSQTMQVRQGRKVTGCLR